jgi:hypothetical protein
MNYLIKPIYILYLIIIICFIIQDTFAQIDPLPSGPDTISSIPEYENPSLADYAEGETSRLAILLTDTSATWLGLVHGFKSMGIPFIITTDVNKAAQHKVVFVYPRISGSILTQDELQTLADIPRNGGILIGTNVLGGLRHNFGIEGAVASKEHFFIEWVLLIQSRKTLLIHMNTILALAILPLGAGVLALIIICQPIQTWLLHIMTEQQQSFINLIPAATPTR